MMEASDEEIEVIIQSVLPSGSPQGKFRVKVPSNFSVEGLMRRVCKEANVPLLPYYVLKNAKNEVLPSLETLDNVEVTHGSILHWGDEHVEPKNVKSMCNIWWFLCLIAFLIGAVGLVAIGIIKSEETQVTYSYGIVFDAGSSHTSMYIYEWNGAKLNETAVASQFGEPVTPQIAGISSFTDDPKQGESVVKFCLDKAKDTIPTKNWKTTPVYLGATAGMRMLNKVNSTISQEILDVIRNKISEYPFQYNASDIRIISGEEEGAFSWITSNYVSGIFHVTPMSHISSKLSETVNSKTSHLSSKLSETVNSKTKGALDLGGASAQITFIPSEKVVLPHNYSYNLELYDRNYTLYTHSFLCYGINEAQRRYNAALIKSQNYSLTIQDPCAPLGWEKNVSHASIFQAPCVSGQHAIQAFGYRIVSDEDLDDVTYLFNGTSDVQKCQSFVPENLFNFNSSTCPQAPCSFNGIYQPDVSGDYYAFSTFYYVTNFLNLTDAATTTFNLTEFREEIVDFCSKTWDEVKIIPAAKKSALPFYCFQSNFIDVILTQGYGFNESNWENLHFVEKVANTKVGWSLGFMLNKSNGLPVNLPNTTITTVTFVLLAILFGVFILAAVGFACHARLYRVAKTKRRYSRLAEYGSI